MELLAQSFDERAVDLVGLDDALQWLEDRDPVMAQVGEMRFFGGASMDQIAGVVQVPKRTLERRWNITRSWLSGQVGPGALGAG